MYGKEEKPKVSVPYSVLDRVLLTLVFVAIAWSVGYLIAEWPGLPDKVPAHFNGKGEIDRWGDKRELIILPAIGLVLCVGLAVLSRFPHVYNYPVKITEENAAGQYALARGLIGWLNLEIALLFAYIQWTTIQAAKGAGDGMGIWSVPLILVVLLGTLVVYMNRAFRMK